MNIAIVGATGLVGRKIIEVLEERKIEANYFLFGSHSVGKKIEMFNKSVTVEKLEVETLGSYNLDYAFFAVESELSRQLIPYFACQGIKVIDNSNAFRRREDVALVVPQVNREVLKKTDTIFANPNCSTIQLVTVLKPLDEKFGLKRVVVSTYQAVSGAGKEGIEDLLNDTQNHFAYPIKNNLIPHIDVFLENGYSREEDKLIFESRKILGKSDLKITATAVRVPVLNGHSESVNIELEKPATAEEIRKVLSSAENVIVQDDVEKQVYPMPIFADGKDEVFVGRIRQDYSHDNAFNMFVVADNLRRGAASNAVDIFEELEGK